VCAERRRQDHFARRAKQENYPARSIYKLEEIDKRIHLFRRGDKVVDLGASPGSWTLYISDKVGSTGLVVAIDRNPLTVGVPGHVTYLQANALELDVGAVRPMSGDQGFDAVVSDMAPRTSGNKFVDQSRSFELFVRALELGAELLRPGGHFVGKIFQGEDFEKARDRVRQLFATCKIIRPRSVRSESYEIYVVGLGRKQSGPIPRIM
jgi:23S rRNA (uridine2552-2'-O)-methyltransferase